MTRYERMKMQRRMQRRIRLVVEERRMALAQPPATEPAADPEAPADSPVPPLEQARPASP
jgi:hypothetical protein